MSKYSNARLFAQDTRRWLEARLSTDDTEGRESWAEDAPVSGIIAAAP